MILRSGFGQTSIGSSRWRIRLRPTQSEPLASPRGHSPGAGVEQQHRGGQRAGGQHHHLGLQRQHVGAMLGDHLLHLGAVGLQAQHPAFGQQVGAVLGDGGQHAVAGGVVFARLVAEIGLAGGAALGVIAGHRQVVGVQSAPGQVVDQRLVVRRERRRRRAGRPSAASGRRGSGAPRTPSSFSASAYQGLIWS